MKTRSASRLTLHGWLALSIWAFLFIVCLTWSIATVSQEIVWLANPAVRAQAPTADERLLGYDDILTAVEREVPGARVRFISRPVKSIFALNVSVTRPDGTSGTLFVNPAARFADYRHRRLQAVLAGLPAPTSALE